MGCVGFALLQARGTGVIQNEAKAQATLARLCQEGVLEACTQLAVLIAPSRTPADMARVRELLTQGVRRQARARVRDVEVDAEGRRLSDVSRRTRARAGCRDLGRAAT